MSGSNSGESGKTTRSSVTNNTEYYDKLPHYAPPTLCVGGAYGVLSLTLGELWHWFTWGGCDG